jgi:hypothetical protein
MSFLVSIGILTVAFSLMALALSFSKYKKRQSGCCGGTHCGDKEYRGCQRGKTASIEKRPIKT